MLDEPATRSGAGVDDVPIRVAAVPGALGAIRVVVGRDAEGLRLVEAGAQAFVTEQDDVARFEIDRVKESPVARPTARRTATSPS